MRTTLCGASILSCSRSHNIGYCTNKHVSPEYSYAGTLPTAFIGPFYAHSQDRMELNAYYNTVEGSDTYCNCDSLTISTDNCIQNCVCCFLLRENFVCLNTKRLEGLNIDCIAHLKQAPTDKT